MQDIHNKRLIKYDRLMSLFDGYTKLPSLGLQRGKTEEILNKILESSEYKSKLEEVLPLLTSFLNYDYSPWEASQTNADERWKRWLSQSFIEASVAYDGVQAWRRKKLIIAISHNNGSNK